MREFIKKEIILIVAWLLAIASMFLVHPSKAYLQYIDWRTLGILWSLMIIMAGLKKHGFFDSVGNKLLNATNNVKQLVFVLVFLCFFFSMLITNDVALITFVPFAILILKKCKSEHIMIPVIALQTIAANTGSMLTPIGNPQNLYLYELSSVNLGRFIGWVLPYTIVAGVAIIVTVFIITSKTDKNRYDNCSMEGQNGFSKIWIIYFLLFALALLVVSRFISYYILIAVVFVVVLIIDKDIIIHVDYSLLLTFVGFFIFTGNVENIEKIRIMMQEMVAGNELLFGVGLSQIISNVPAALLLSNFTDNIKDLLIGVNLGGLGTLIASMASLISFKIFANEYSDQKANYIACFTMMNIIYLVPLLICKYLLS